MIVYAFSVYMCAIITTVYHLWHRNCSEMNDNVPPPQCDLTYKGMIIYFVCHKFFK